MYAKKFRQSILFLFLIAVGFALGSCRSEEQGRPTEFKQGEYLGQSDQKLSAEQVNELRFRARNQGS